MFRVRWKVGLLKGHGLLWVRVCCEGWFVVGWFSVWVGGCKIGLLSRFIIMFGIGILVCKKIMKCLLLMEVCDVVR